MAGELIPTQWPAAQKEGVAPCSVQCTCPLQVFSKTC